MKGTRMEITGQESGFYLEGKYCSLENWSSDMDQYTADLRRVRKIKNCFFFLLKRGFIKFYDDDVVIEYDESACPVTLKDLMVGGALYDFGDFEILAPEGWN